MLLSTAIQNFLLACQAERLSRKTLASYELHLRQFLQYTGDLPVSEITPEHITRFIAHEGVREGKYGPLAPSSVHKAYSVVRRFFRKNGELSPDDVRELVRYAHYRLSQRSA